MESPRSDSSESPPKRSSKNRPVSYQKHKPLEQRKSGSGRPRSLFPDKKFEDLTDEERKQLGSDKVHHIYCRSYYELNKEKLREKARQRYYAKKALLDQSAGK